jgi:hypothetical protein
VTGGAWAGGNAGPPCRALHVMAPLPLPVGDATDFDMGYSQSEFSVDLCVNVLVRPTRVFRRASQGPQGRVVPFGGARQGPIVGYVLQLAAPTGPSP